jgi:hypothetical protein
MNKLHKKILLIGLGCLTAAASYASAPGDPQGTPRRNFTQEEDELLRILVAQYGTSNWSLIARLMPDRSRRQCRERWRNYLSPEIGHSEWTLEEDDLLREKVSRLGTKWALIAAFFPNRTPENIRNRWRVLQRRSEKQQPEQQQQPQELSPEQQRAQQPPPPALPLFPGLNLPDSSLQQPPQQRAQQQLPPLPPFFCTFDDFLESFKQ